MELWKTLQLPQEDVFCIDCKSFFASVESLKRCLHPLESRLCVVSRDDNRSGLVLASSMSMKHHYGIKTGTRTYEIPQGLDDILLVPPRMATYIEENRKLNEILLRFVSAEDWHPYSIDEGFINVTANRLLYGSPMQLAQLIQQTIWQELNLVVSIGIGRNPLMAKLALDLDAKHQAPTYISQWDYNTIPEKLWPIDDLSSVWGIGKRTERRLNQLNIYSMGDLAQADLALLKKEFGIIGEQLYYHAYGIDFSDFSERYIPQSKGFGKSQVLTKDYRDRAEIERVISEMTDQVAARLRKHHFQACKIHLSLGFSKSCYAPRFSHQMTVDGTASSFDLIEAMLQLFRQHYRGHPVRSIAVQLGDIQAESGMQLNLFEDPAVRERRFCLERTIDQLRDHYGYQSVVRTSSLMPGATAIARSKLVGGHLG